MSRRIVRLSLSSISFFDSPSTSSYRVPVQTASVSNRSAASRAAWVRARNVRARVDLAKPLNLPIHRDSGRSQWSERTTRPRALAAFQNHVLAGPHGSAISPSLPFEKPQAVARDGGAPPRSIAPRRERLLLAGQHGSAISPSKRFKKPKAVARDGGAPPKSIAPAAPALQLAVPALRGALSRVARWRRAAKIHRPAA